MSLKDDLHEWSTMADTPPRLAADLIRALALVELVEQMPNCVPNTPGAWEWANKLREAVR